MKAIRTLRPGEAAPAGEPRRYVNAAGYVRLRWKVGVRKYVEVYEHRLVAGMPAGRQVHHCNYVRDDNDGANLEPLTAQDHSRRHKTEARIRRMSQRPVDPRVRDAIEDGFDAYWRRAAELYDNGMSTPEIAEAFGVDCSMISRGLKTRGTQARTKLQTFDMRIAHLRPELERALIEDAMSQREMERVFGVGRPVISRVRRELGLPPARIGRRKST